MHLIRRGRFMATTHAASAPSTTSAALLGQLGSVCHQQGLADLATRLGALQAWVAAELAGFEVELAMVQRGPRVVQRAAHHLLDLGGKHLRPMCVALASKCGDGFGASARGLAVAVELVHSATLLHDDVVDVAATRRGQPAARTLYGNAASIFAGDWLLVEALRRIAAAGVPGLVERMLDIIEEMILAESLQLERRGRLRGDIADYFRVVEGKTAALFRWAMHAGARAGGLDDGRAAALERYGLHLGVAFQAIDDLLDFAGDASITGKGLYADLREGKLTYPVLIALERRPGLEEALAELVAADGEGRALPARAMSAVGEALRASGALDDCRALAQSRAQAAIDSLAPLGGGPAVQALITVAEATVHRER
jgi:octaprenyl-diphosphate synthase